MKENENRITQVLTEEELDKAAGGHIGLEEHPVTKVDRNNVGCEQWLVNPWRSMFQVIGDKKDPRCGNCACFSRGSCSACVIR